MLHNSNNLILNLSVQEYFCIFVMTLKVKKNSSRVLMSSNGIYVCLIYVCPCGQSALNDISFCLPWCEVFYTLSHFKYYAVNRLFRKNAVLKR